MESIALILPLLIYSALNAFETDKHQTAFSKQTNKVLVKIIQPQYAAKHQLPGGDYFH